MICLRFTDSDRDDEEREYTGQWVQVEVPQVRLDGVPVARFREGKWYINYRFNGYAIDYKGWKTLTVAT